jgi:hypothetical protein
MFSGITTIPRSDTCLRISTGSTGMARVPTCIWANNFHAIWKDEQMKFPEPEYAQTIVVGVVFRHAFAWYVTDREYWYLDYPKYKRALLASGYNKPIAHDYAQRFDIAILNEDTAEHFLSQIEDRRVPANALSEMMLVQRQMYEEYSSLDSLDYYNDILDFSPCFLVNFDRREFASSYPEMIRFEHYIPDGWTGAYRNFLAEVPQEERYWMVDGRNVFERR